MGQTEENVAGNMSAGGDRPRARWTALATTGLLMEAAAPVLMVLAAVFWGMDVGDAPFLLGAAAIAIVGALLVRFFGTWAKIVGIVTALIPAGLMFWTAFGLAVPSSFFDFVPGLLVVPGMLIAIPSCIGALVAGRRGHTGVKATGGERTAVRVVLGVLALAVIASGILTFTGRSSVSATSSGPTILAKDFQFDPNAVETDAGATILVRNDDPFFHTFTIDEFDIDEELSPGDEVTVQIPNETGSFVFYCEPHTSDREDPEISDEGDMAGRLRVG